MIDKIKTYLELVKFSHTIFAIPFGLSAVFIIEKGFPSWEKIFWILVALVSARTAGMAFNRFVDRPIDAKNPRTKDWPSAKGEVRPNEIMALGLISSIIFIFSAYKLSMLAFWLSPVVILLLLLYPAGKRFTSYVHLILGLVYFLIPIAVSIALKGSIEISAIFLGIAMAFWVAGFDILYALQDYEFDKSFGLYSIPVKYGIKNAILISRTFHFITFICLILTGVFAGLSYIYFTGVFILSGFLVYEHLLIKENDLSKINKAFFTVNGFISIIFSIVVLLDVFIGG